MKVKAIIYDFDGPILDSYQEALRRIQRLCAVHDLPYGRKERFELIKLWGAYGPTLLRDGLGITQEMADAIYPGWERMDVEEPISLVQGAREVLLWAQRNDIKNCLLTSRRTKNTNDILKRIDVLRYFDVLSCSEQAGEFKKPDPRAFFFVQENLKDLFGIPPEECIFVGDTETDVKAGHAAGYATLVVMTGPYTLQSGDHTVELTNMLRSVDDLPFWVEKNHDGELPIFYG